VSSRGADFFISHAGRDTAWAEWTAWQLQQAGYSVELDVWDWAPGEDFVVRMQSALERADRVLAVCTEAYFSSAFGGAELRAAFVDQARAEGRVVPVLVEPVTLPALYAPLIPLDLIGLDEATAAARLILALIFMADAEPARALGEDTLQRCRRKFGPDRRITVWAATALTLALVQLGQAESARARGEDTLQRSRRVLGRDNPITSYLTQAAGGGHPMPGGDAAADRPDPPR
jgi:hypothetical protein